MRMRWVRHVAYLGEKRNGYRVLVGKPGERRALGSLSDRWEDNTKMELERTGWEGVDWIHLAQDRE
jgi:hypothetical protein